MRKTCLSICLATLLSGCAATTPIKTSSKILPPSKMQVELDVSGRTSTLKNIDIQYVGKNIPRTYSDGKITNSRGYDWWVSKHFALKSDLPEEKVRLYLELLEMSYPHYVELFGMEPSNIENQRIAVVYGSSRARVREAMLDDGFLRGVHTHAGGETMFYNRAGYSFPSHRQHHQRYIVIHETMHAFHMTLNGHSTWAPNWITEGMADAIASHTFDPQKKQLNVMVFDRAPMNYLTSGLAQYHQGGQPSFEQINDNPSLKRGLNFFIVHFLLSDPTRYHYFKRYLKELMRANPDSQETLPTANKLLKATFPDWPTLEAEFSQFVKTAQSSFYIVQGPWEQSGAGYFLRSDKSETLHRLDIIADNDSLQTTLDFPAPSSHPLIMPVSKNSLAALIHFEPEQVGRGEIGIGLLTELSKDSKKKRLGLLKEADFSQDKMLTLLIKNGNKLEFNGAGYDESSQYVSLTPEAIEDIQKYQQLALNLTKLDDQLVVTLNTKSQSQKVTFNMPKNAQDKVNLQQIAILGKAMNHTLTPYVFGHTASVVSLNESIANPWLYRDAPLAMRAFNTCEEFTHDIPQCRTQLKNAFDKLTDQNKHDELSTQLRQYLTLWRSQIHRPTAKTLSGIELQLRFDNDQPFVKAINPSDSVAELILTGEGGKAVTHSLLPGKSRFDLTDNTATYGYKLNWQDIQQSGLLDVESQRFDGVYLNASLQQKQLKIALTGPYSGATSGELAVQFLPFEKPVKSAHIWQESVDISPYEQKIWQPAIHALPNLKDGILEVTATLEVDGEPVKLQQRIKL
ncbi:hypothetical protein [Pseudoalteromonas sp. Of7M-16]|uniref:hypothetical protein n=1 Tax=Pseudoalteromonas sp. Of7M-16 TaxID=2917756 RepID=UPI001EF4D301|nr:hypothetical protein [Pseudoalteromonas sp. Of7M-16]MCG7549283.1 hypothetical protein [Pseudoalteromonas sp. Of7M-16]